MRAQEKKQDARINEVKAMVKDDLKIQIAELLRSVSIDRSSIRHLHNTPVSFILQCPNRRRRSGRD